MAISSIWTTFWSKVPEKHRSNTRCHLSCCMLSCQLSTRFCFSADILVICIFWILRSSIRLYVDANWSLTRILVLSRRSSKLSYYTLSGFEIQIVGCRLDTSDFWQLRFSSILRWLFCYMSFGSCSLSTVNAQCWEVLTCIHAQKHSGTADRVTVELVCRFILHRLRRHSQSWLTRSSCLVQWTAD